MRASWLPLAALLIFAASAALFPMSESDLFFRLEAGRQILAHHAIPPVNLYSFTYPDYPDLDLSWLFEVGAALIDRAWGIAGVVVAKALIVTTTIAGAFVLCRRRGAGPLASALALAAAIAVMQERLVERPHIVSFATEIGLLLAIDSLGAGLALALALLAGVALWANLHAGVFVAPIVLALHGAGALGDGDRAGARRAAALGVLAWGAMMATPAGAGIFRYLILHMQIPRLHPVDEFRAATLQSDGALAAYAVVAAAAVALAGPRRIGLRHLLPVAALALLAARTVRFGADFALCAAPLLARAATVLASRVAARASAAPSVAPAVVPASARVLAPVAVAAVLLGLAVGPRVVAARAGRPFVDVSVDESALPLDAIRFADDSGLRDRMYNDFEIGSYLIFQGFPRHRVFIDPRLPAYPPELHRLMGRDDLDRDEWDRAMERYGVESALLAYAGLNRRVSWWDPARWALVYRQHDARIFVRRLPRWRAFIAAHEIPATFNFTVEEGTETVPLPAPPPGSPVAPCEWQRRLGDLLLDLDQGRPARALDAYRRALQAPRGCLAPVDEDALRRWLGAHFPSALPEGAHPGGD